MMNLKPDDPRSQKKGEKGHRSRASPKQKSKQFSFSIPADSIPGKVIADVRAFVQEKINVILSRLVDTFFSRISPTMQLPPKHHSIAYVLPWAEGLHWQSRSSGCSNS